MLVHIRAKFRGHSVCLWDFMEGDTLFMIPIFVTVFVKNYYIFLLKNGLLLLSNRFTFLSLDNIPGAEPTNQTLKEAQDTLQSEGKC